ncbi:phage portal protein [Puniceibacterium sediminis]|uniref:Phage portal protein, lambda family n=1 Tax=Puniceibacterium sediminis TaxID=1608407 RepID=A0A238WFE6_9RHOB|nr:phage portal protein [Puniceibacterium sediminis]SNR45295.1 phage portal protein, lambda family [Puniceibacterium sediminis]
MGLFDRFRRRAPGGPAGVSARLEGALAKRRLRGWQPPLENINSLIASGGPRLLARSRELVVTNGYAANACEAFAANLVGDGIKPSSLIEESTLRDSVQQLWLAWTDEADADGLTDFYGLQAMVAREMFVAGECFVRMRPRRTEDGLLVPMQLQLLQSEMLPFEKTETAANGNRIRCGIEFDGIGRRLAYHFRRRHPGDSTDQGAVIPETVRVPAEDVLHIYRPIDAGQIRGLPHVAPAMVRLFLLDQYDDAELDRKKTAAMFAGFITKTAPEDPMMGESEADLDGAAMASLEPGTMQVLLPGEDVKFSSPADVGGGYEAFQYRTLLSVSASLGLPYHLVTGDVRQANYSSLRAELVEFRRRIGQLQHGVMAHQLCRPIWRRWLETAVLSGALDIGNPAVARPVQWIPPRWDWVDPLKDIQAQVLAMEAGITSRRKVVEATGYDVEEVDRENAADVKRVADLGLSYRASPGETQGARATPAARPDPGDGTGEDTGDGSASTDPATEQE